MNELYFQAYEFLSSSILAQLVCFLFFIFGSTSAFITVLAIVFHLVEKKSMEHFKDVPIMFFILALSFIPWVFLCIGMRGLRMENDTCFMKLVKYPLNDIDVETRIDELERNLHRVKRSLSLATKYQTESIGSIEIEKMAILQELSRINKYTSKEHEYPKMTEFMVIDQDEVGLHYLSDDNQLEHERRLYLSDSKFQRSVCSLQIIALSKKNSSTPDKEQASYKEGNYE